MENIGQTIVYQRKVCQVNDLIKNYRNDEDYYVLSPLYDKSLVMYVPATLFNKQARPIITKQAVEKLIDQIPDIEKVEIDEKLLEATYRDLFKTEKHEDLIRIIKTTYLRNENKAKRGLKTGEKDKTYFRLAENALYNELAIVLDKTPEDTKKYVLDRVQALSDEVDA